MWFSRASRAAMAVGSLLASAALVNAETTDGALMSTPTATPTNIRASSSVGCFATTVPMVWHGPALYQSSGNCQRVCLLFQNTVMGLGNGTDCWCGDALPVKSALVADSVCSSPCSGYGLDFCGGSDALTVFTTGYSLNAVPYWSGGSSSSTVTSAPTVTASSSSSTTASSSGKSSNTVGIVVGVVVGIVALGALAGGGFFYLRRKQQRDMEEYKQANDVKSFVTGTSNDRPGMWAHDNRLDTSGGRRMSNGSIADNEDFSRRILQVRNPDGSGY